VGGFGGALQAVARSRVGASRTRREKSTAATMKMASGEYPPIGARGFWGIVRIRIRPVVGRRAGGWGYGQFAGALQAVARSRVGASRTRREKSTRVIVMMASGEYPPRIGMASGEYPPVGIVVQGVQ